MDQQLYDEMHQMETAHWWFCAKRTIVLALLKKMLPTVSAQDRQNRICDLGCGCGAMLVSLQDAGYDAIGIDSSQCALAYCATRSVSVRKGTLPNQVALEDSTFDAALLLDVLEHIDDVESSLQTALRLVRPGGYVIFTVPAFQWLWTWRDDFHHHKKRYTRPELRRILKKINGTSRQRVTYMNTYLFPLAFVERLANRCIEFRKKPKNLKTPKDLHLVPGPLNWLLKSIYSAERHALSRGINLPYGLSLLGILQKTENA